MSSRIIGADAIGQAIATQLARAGLNIVISNSRGPQSLNEIVRTLGPHITTGTSQDAARSNILTNLEEAILGARQTEILAQRRPFVFPTHSAWSS